MIVRVHNLPFVMRVGGVAAHRSVDGVVKVQARIVGVPARTVGLYLDGRQIDHDTSRPYIFTWDTRLIPDGPHLLQLRAHARDGRLEVQSIPVLVSNPAVVSQSLVDGQTVFGPVTWTVQTLGPVRRVDFLVDGVVVGSASAAPWSFAWNPAGLAPGVHVVAVHAVAPNSSVDSTLTVVVPPSG